MSSCWANFFSFSPSGVQPCFPRTLQWGHNFLPCAQLRLPFQPVPSCLLSRELDFSCSPCLSGSDVTCGSHSSPGPHHRWTGDNSPGLSHHLRSPFPGGSFSFRPGEPFWRREGVFVFKIREGEMLDIYRETGEALQVLPQMILNFFNGLMSRHRFSFLPEFRVSYYYANASAPLLLGRLWRR